MRGRLSILFLLAAVVIAVGFIRIASAEVGEDALAGLGVIMVGSALLVVDAVERIGRR